MTTGSVVPEVLHPWTIYLRASEEARRRGDRRTGTEHVLLGLLEDPSIEVVLGVSLQQARQALESLDQEALGALGVGSSADAPPLPMRTVPKKPTIRAVMKKDRLRMTPAAKRVLEEAVKPMRRKTQVTAQQVLAQILTLQPPDPAAVLLGALGVNTSEVRRRSDAVTPDS
jgi:ATP-dependent Clp protease ATP-binding subunit ClpA